MEYIRKLKTDQHRKRILEEKVRQQDSQNRKLLLKIQVRGADSISDIIFNIFGFFLFIQKIKTDIIITTTFLFAIGI